MTKTKRQLRAEAAERLKNCVAARFDAESIVIALTSGRHGQSDWSLECDKLIYLLTDDDSTTESLSDEPDTREKLEADMREYFSHWIGGTSRTQAAIIGWLDRQEAITEQKCLELGAAVQNQRDKRIAELTAERDELREENEALREWKACYERIKNERDELKSWLGWRG